MTAEIEYFEVTEAELTAILERSQGSTEAVPLSFGASGVYLGSNRRSSEWALAQLAEIRGVSVDEIQPSRKR